jgi:hypothetical protein
MKSLKKQFATHSWTLSSFIYNSNKVVSLSVVDYLKPRVMQDINSTTWNVIIAITVQVRHHHDN